jgi:hypothetical protein
MPDAIGFAMAFGLLPSINECHVRLLLKAFVEHVVHKSLEWAGCFMLLRLTGHAARRSAARLL